MNSHSSYLTSSFLVLVSYIFSGFIRLSAASTQVSSTTVPSPAAKPQQVSADQEKSIPPWLVGVIVLSCLALIIIVGTIVQKILRKRAESHERYRMSS